MSVFLRLLAWTSVSVWFACVASADLVPGLLISECRWTVVLNSGRVLALWFRLPRPRLSMRLRETALGRVVLSVVAAVVTVLCSMVLVLLACLR